MWITIYCDASTKDGKSTGSYWIKSELGRVVESISLVATDSRMAEFEIALKAIERAKIAHIDTQITGLLVVSDNQEVVNRLKWDAQLSKNPEVARFQNTIRQDLRSRSIYIRTKWQKGHSHGQTTGSWINNRVDQLARQKREAR